jgi:hypothetical protein
MACEVVAAAACPFPFEVVRMLLFRFPVPEGPGLRGDLPPSASMVPCATGLSPIPRLEGAAGDGERV